MVADRPNIYVAKDRKYTTTADTVTMSRFGPSGSLKKKNIALEQTIAVTNKMRNEVFFDLKCIFGIIARKPQVVDWPSRLEQKYTPLHLAV